MKTSQLNTTKSSKVVVSARKKVIGPIMEQKNYQEGNKRATMLARKFYDLNFFYGEENSQIIIFNSVLLSYGTESIILGSNFRKEDFNGFTSFEVP